MQWLILFIFGIQGLAMFFDEFYYHIRRGLPRWERLGHPIDAVSVIGSLAFMLTHEFNSENLVIFSCLAVFSSILVTKDEFVHSEYCEPGEQWLHAVLFILHPLIFVASGLVWTVRGGGFNPEFLTTVTVNWNFLWLAIQGQTGLAVLFLIYQIVFWNTSLLGKRKLV
jgi:hypothetical protein